MSNSELVDEMRALLADLSARQVSDDVAASMATRVKQLRSMIEGPRRFKWHDRDHPDLSTPADTRRAFAEMSLYRGSLNPMAPPLRYESDGTGANDRGRVVGAVNCGPRFEGPPGGVHGGYLAGLFDDVLGHVTRLVGGGCVTGRLAVRYRRITPLDTELRLVAWIDHARGRRIVAKAQCWADETLTAEAEGLFIRVDYSEVAEQSRVTAEGAR